MTPGSVKAVEYNSVDFRVEWFSGTGAGGQHRNKHQNSCRIIHSSGLVVTAQCRSRENSMNQAKAEILSRLNQLHKSSLAHTESKDRKEQVGSGMRGDKIRTYRFQDNTVKDHITEKQASLSKVLAGNFQLLWN